MLSTTHGNIHKSIVKTTENILQVNDIYGWLVHTLVHLLVYSDEYIHSGFVYIATSEHSHCLFPNSLLQKWETFAWEGQLLQRLYTSAKVRYRCFKELIEMDVKHQDIHLQCF